MILPPANSPLYGHSLIAIEQWLRTQGCEQDLSEKNCWSIERPNWKAEIELEVEEILVRYIQAGEDGNDIQRAFPYSLSRGDIESAIFSGP